MIQGKVYGQLELKKFDFKNLGFQNLQKKIEQQFKVKIEDGRKEPWKPSYEYFNHRLSWI